MYRDIKKAALTSDEFSRILEDLDQGGESHMRKFFINRKSISEWHCDVCGTNLRSIDGILSGDKTVICSKCQKKVCKSQCSNFSQQIGWICKTCQRPPESWFQGILNAIQPNNRKAHWLGAMNLPHTIPPNDDSATNGQNEKEQVRDFLERLVNVMLGENVDDASISKLYNDKLYDDIFARYHRDLSQILTDFGSALHISIANLPITGQSPCSSHAALKQIIERLLRETGALPNLGQAQDRPSDESGRTYEDLLATAIINKVISSSQNNLPTSSRASASSRLSNSSRNHDKEYFFGEETLDSKWKTTDLETSSVSSIEDWIHSDSSFGSKKYVDKISLTIKQDIEEVSQSDSDEEDDSEYFRTKSSLLSEDEPNWFLQKRQFHSTHSPVPVPMLIPNPTTEAKVLIGDKEVDETSDLSDIASDFEEPESIPTRHSLLIESKTIIGGKNFLRNTGSESESSADSGVKEVDGADKSGYDLVDAASPTKARADITVDDDNVEDASILSVYSNTEQEAEYTERYASLPRTMLKSPTLPRRPSLQKHKPLEKRYEEPNNNDMDYDIEDEHVVENFSGIYSRREKEKWKHAIHMENNPYSKENIEKRIKRSSSSVSSLFGPDYYARQASSPAGTKKSQEVAGITWPPPDPKEEEVQEVQIILSDESNMNSSSNNNSFDIEIAQDDVFEAEEPIKPMKLLTATPFRRPETSYSDTSDTDLSYTHYYDVENSRISKKSKDESTNSYDMRNPADNDNDLNPKLDESSNNIKEKLDYTPQSSDPPTPVTDRSIFVKLNSVSRPRSIHKPDEIAMKRHKSESDLLEGIDLRPRVISKKKDNTLISKIYSNPQVRQFVLSSRNQLPPDEPASRSENSGRYNGKRSLYDSDDGMSRSGVNLLSSTEDLLSTKHDATPASIRNYQIRKPKYSFSSEDDLLSETGSIHIESTKHNTNNSSDDLICLDVNENLDNRKDDTIVSDRIRNNSNSKDLESRLSSSKLFSSSEDLLSDDSRKAERPKLLLLSRSPLHFSDRNSTPSPDIEELAKKKIVHNILDQLTKSQPDAITPSRDETNTVKKEAIIDERSTSHISVKDLMKCFENNDATSRVVSSLTARSLSKQMREELKN